MFQTIWEFGEMFEKFSLINSQQLHSGFQEQGTETNENASAECFFVTGMLPYGIDDLAHTVEVLQCFRIIASSRRIV